MNAPNEKEIANFYDQFTDAQKKTGINIRHRSILKRLVSLGMNEQSRVMEIGCGIGTLTTLLAKKTKHLVAVDISPQSIEIAKTRLSKYPLIDWVVSDMNGFHRDEKFDFIILPDVLEHIPFEAHQNLFKVIKAHLKENGKACIHIPDPYALEWIRINQPHLLQIIDQSIYTNLLVENVYINDLVIHRLERYCLQKTLPDYQWIEIIHRPSYKNFTNKEYHNRFIDEVKSRL